MVTPSDKLAQSLETLKEFQDKGIVAIRTKNMTRTHRERLLKNGFIKEVIKGWYISSRPDEPTGESTAWYASFWGFCSDYLNSRFKDEWCLSPEQSLSIHSGNWSVRGRGHSLFNHLQQLTFDKAVLVSFFIDRTVVSFLLVFSLEFTDLKRVSFSR